MEERKKKKETVTQTQGLWSCEDPESDSNLTFKIVEAHTVWLLVLSQRHNQQLCIIIYIISCCLLIVGTHERIIIHLKKDSMV